MSISKNDCEKEDSNIVDQALEDLLETIVDEKQRVFIRLVSALSAIGQADKKPNKFFNPSDATMVFILAKKITSKGFDPNPDWLYNDFKKFYDENGKRFPGPTLIDKYVSVYSMRYNRAHPWD